MSELFSTVDIIGGIIEVLVVIGVIGGAIISVTTKLKGKLELKELQNFQQRIAEQFKPERLTGYQQREDFKTTAFTLPAKEEPQLPAQDFTRLEENLTIEERPWYQAPDDSEHEPVIEAAAPIAQHAAAHKPMKARETKKAALDSPQAESIKVIVRRNSLRDMMIAKEILDRPLSRRERKGFGVAR